MPSRANRTPGRGTTGDHGQWIGISERRAPPAYLTSEQPGQLTDDHVRPVRTERVGPGRRGRRRRRRQSVPPGPTPPSASSDMPARAGFETEGSSTDEKGFRGAGSPARRSRSVEHAIDYHSPRALAAASCSAHAAARCKRTPGWNLPGSSASRSSAYRAYQAASCAASLALNGLVSPLSTAGLVTVVLTAQAKRTDVAVQQAALLSRSRPRIANGRASPRAG